MRLIARVMLGGLVVLGTALALPAGPAGASSTAVTSVAPTKLPLSGGKVTIHGRNFTLVMGVRFGTARALRFHVHSSRTLVVPAPPHSAGTVHVTVTTISGTSAKTAEDLVTYVAAPAVRHVSPASGLLLGGTSVTITGTGFTGVTAVRFGMTAATSYRVSGNTITATAPAHVPGLVDVSVRGRFGTSAVTSSDHFTYEPSPTTNAVP